MSAPEPIQPLKTLIETTEIDLLLRFVLPIGLLVLALAAYFVFLSETPDSAARGRYVPEVEHPPVDGEHDVAVSENGSESAVAHDSSPCVPIEEFVSGPDGYRLDSWFMSWGAPPITNSPDSTAAYSWYDDKTLNELGQAGDAVAKHERGRRLVIAALTGVNTPSEGSSIWDVAIDSSEVPLLQDIDRSTLSSGRGDLFDAAVLGRTYALIEIAVSYALEQQVLLAAGEESSEALAELNIKSVAFGEAAERLVPPLHSDFFQSSLPSELRPLADREIDEIVKRVHRERSERGVTVQQTDDETTTLFYSLNICQERGGTTNRKSPNPAA